MTLAEIIANANSNSEFIPGTSSNEMFYGTLTDERLTDVIADVAEACQGKAPAEHSHTGYAPASHTHDGYAAADHVHSGYAAVNHSHTPASIGAAAATHSHDYAAPDHTHTPSSIGAAAAEHSHDYAAPTHSHDQDDVDGLTEALAGKAASTHSHTEYAAASHTHDYAAGNHTHTPASIGAAAAEHSHNYAAPTHTHAQSEITGLETALAAKADASALTGKADLVDGKIPASQLPGFVDDVLEYDGVENFPATGEAGKIYVNTDDNKTYRWSGTGYVEISQGVALGETSATAYRGDRGKIAYDHSQNGTVHVTEAQKTAWDSKAAGDHTHTPAAIGAAPASHAHSYNNLTDKPTIPAAYTHPTSHPASMISGLATVATSGKYSDLTGNPTIPTTLPANGGNADTVDGKHASDFATANHSHTGYAASGHTHTASDVGAAAAAHTHTAAAIGAAPASHSHSEYAASNHGHTGYADEDHTHTAADVGALPSSGGTVNGDLVVTGAGTIRGKAYTQQILPFDGGSYSIGSSDNRYYSTYLRVNPNVSSDLRCKRDIVSMDIDALAAFVDKLAVVSYNYIDDAADEAKRIGLIAQEVVTADPEIAKGCIEQDEKGFYSLRAADLVFPLIAAVQALTKRVKELESK